MENEIVYVNPQKTQVIYQYFRYQRASKNSEIYVCVKRTCGATLKPEPRIRNNIEHHHPEESHCETECLLAFKNLTRHLEENPDLNPPELYRKAYERLAKTYSHKELSQFWKPYSKVRNVIAHHVRKNKPKIPKETKEIKI
ncbi:unnamed protein product [Brachionus calyciflorus]|uniref:FLYWCH-type domain-containing protein n=1 Tax=Brachionus calyciflorus TaxID=104777 RepID=A0A814IAR1_9BILA|nr:unnamed protein product [Brachionus calyciflorus]